MRIVFLMSGVLGVASGVAWADGVDTVRERPQWKASCGTGRAVLLETIVAPEAERLAATTIRYVSTKERSLELADCSGNFLRLSSKIAEQCPKRADDLAILAGVPDWNGTLVDGSLLRNASWISEHDKVRTTRNTAEWYQQRGLFVPVFADRNRPAKDGSKHLDRVRDWFRPGTVVWYGEALSKRDCTARECRSDLVQRIRHMGVVVGVTYDESGAPVSYELYHGRNERHDNGITSHKWDGSGPPFGNGGQSVLGVAPIVKARRRR